ncbi:DUF4405 domain-containing protein [Alginatibacterium sediminis]|uniref:DUF4405 domain-containing protein n=2 Tax=Alginatibacterium sediminis TaxID=2164068 RepID=A0A420EII9_9ALTE|nr:DUF4405 domain-containing protein [Alginatibacterium sediminis]
MDAWLLIGFILVCAPNTTGIVLHEWLSLVFIVPLIIHMLLHWDWMKTLPNKFIHNFSSKSRFNAIWDVFFFVAMMMVILSGFLVSVAMFPQLGIPLEVKPFWSEIHHSIGNILLPILGIHLALHWQWIKSMTQKMMAKANQRKES